MTSFNYFFTPVGPKYKKKFARNVAIALVILFAFYGIWMLSVDLFSEQEPEPKCAFYFEKLQETIDDIRKTDYANVSAYLEQLDSALEFKKKILELDCLSNIMPWFHLVTGTEKIPNPSQIEIEQTYDKVIKVTNNVLIIPERVVPWKIVEYLEQQRIEYEIVPYEFAQTDEGWTDPTRLCSTLRFLNGTDFFASATFHPEPLDVTGIFIDLERPKDCQKYFDLPQ